MFQKWKSLHLQLQGALVHYTQTWTTGTRYMFSWMILMQLPLLKFFILFSFQWFNLNSLLTGPELISDTYLALFLAQLQQEGIEKKQLSFTCLDVALQKRLQQFICAGYSIFVIRGNLPECEAEQILGIMRVQQQQRPRLIGEEEAQTSSGYVCVACVVWRTQEMLIKESHTFCFVLLKRNLWLTFDNWFSCSLTVAGQLLWANQRWPLVWRMKLWMKMKNWREL